MRENLRVELQERLSELYAERLDRVLVFGSYARGEALRDSDLDVLIVLEGEVDRPTERDRLSDLILDMIDEHDLVVSPIVVSTEEYEKGDYPLVRSVRSEGVPL